MSLPAAADDDDVDVDNDDEKREGGKEEHGGEVRARVWIYIMVLERVMS